MVQNRSTDWDDLRVFLAVARAGSLRGAARQLRLSHATVSRRLRALQAGFGSRLFERGRDGLALTAAGDNLLRSAERIEDELFQARHAVAGHDADLSGWLKVSLPFAILRGFLAADLRAFARRYPGIELELELSDRFSDLNRLQADVSIRMAHEVSDDVAGRRLLRYAKSIYAAPEVATALASADGDGNPAAWIGWHAGDGDVSWVRGTPYPKLPVRHNLASHALQVDAARAGLGLAMLPCFLGDREPGLVRVPGAVPVPDRSIWLLLRKDLRQQARIRAFVDFIAAAILARRALLEGRSPAVAG